MNIFLVILYLTITPAGIDPDSGQVKSVRAEQVFYYAAKTEQEAYQFLERQHRLHHGNNPTLSVEGLVVPINLQPLLQQAMLYNGRSRNTASALDDVLKTPLSHQRDQP